MTKCDSVSRPDAGRADYERAANWQGCRARAGTFAVMERLRLNLRCRAWEKGLARGDGACTMPGPLQSGGPGRVPQPGQGRGAARQLQEALPGLIGAARHMAQLSPGARGQRVANQPPGSDQ